MHGTWWECDDTSVQPYSKRADEQEAGEIRAVILQRMQIPGQIVRSGQEIITLQEARREVERWWKMPHLGSRGQGEGERLRHWKRLQERGEIAPARIERLLRTWPELDEEQGVRENDEGARVMSTEGLEGDAAENKDGTITVGNLQNYLSEKVPRFAMQMSRKQEPQLIGDSARVLVSK